MNQVAPCAPCVGQTIVFNLSFPDVRVERWTLSVAGAWTLARKLIEPDGQQSARYTDRPPRSYRGSGICQRATCTRMAHAEHAAEQLPECSGRQRVSEVPSDPWTRTPEGAVLAGACMLPHFRRRSIPGTGDSSHNSRPNSRRASLWHKSDMLSRNRRARTF